MRLLPYILLYILLSALWSVLFYNFLAAEKGPQTMLFMFGAFAFFSLIWAVLVSLTHKWVGWKSYGMLALPVVILVVFILGVDNATFKYTLGIMAASMLVTYTKILLYRRKYVNK